MNIYPATSTFCDDRSFIRAPRELHCQMQASRHATDWIRRHMGIEGGRQLSPLVAIDQSCAPEVTVKVSALDELRQS